MRRNDNWVMLTTYSPVFFNLVPGLGDWFLGLRIMAFVNSGLFVATVLTVSHLFGAPWQWWVATGLAISHAYRTTYIIWMGRWHGKETKSYSILRQHILHQPYWWLPILRWPWLPVAFAVMSVYLLGVETEFSLQSFAEGFSTARLMIADLLHPEWALLSDAVFLYAKQTAEIALLGTVFGALVALPLSFICARNLMTSHYVTSVIYYFSRGIMVVVRAVPTFLWGLIFVALVGIGPFPGVLAIFVFSVGIMVKLFSEAIENIIAGPTEAVLAAGGTPMHVVMFSVLPQALPALIAQTLYCAEINVHSATILGLIGAEGIGLPIHEYLSSLAYNSASVYILVTIVMTVVIDYFSAYVRSKVQ